MTDPFASIFTGGSDSAPMIPTTPPMAMSNDDPLTRFFKLFAGESDSGGLMAPNGQTLAPAWQQELLKSIDPEKQRNDNRRKALLAASQALMTAPGNALQGLAAGAGAGAQQWQTGQDDAATGRMSVLKTLLDDQTARNAAEQSHEKLLYDRNRDARTDARADATANSLINYRDRQSDIARRKADYDARKIDLQIGGTGSGLTYAQRRMANDSILKAVSDYREAVLGRAFSEDDRIAAEQQVAQYESRLYARYGLDPDTGDFPRGDGTQSNPAPGIISSDPNALRVTPGAPGKTDFGGGLSSAQSTGTGNEPFTPQSIADLDAMPKGTIYINPADGQRYRKN